MSGDVSAHAAAVFAAVKHRNARRGLLALAGVVVLALTVWALVLPGVTMANATFCGQEEHEHSDACYQEVLVCGFGEDGEVAGGSAANADDSSSSAEGSTAASGGAAGSAGVVESGAENAAGSETGSSSASSADGAASAGASSDVSDAASSGAGANASDSGFAGADAFASDGADTALPSSEGAIDGAAALSSAGDAVVLASGNADGVTPALAATSSDAAALGLGAESGAGSSSSASGHVHTAACYERVLACGLSEHEHSLACYSDSSADLETEAVWEATLPADDEMTGSWAADVLAVAKSQLGYRESSANYVVAENAAGAEVAKGYTRYGAWWGDAYGDWCAMFASFCLSYAGVPEEAVPQNANCQNWIEALSAEGVQLWRPVELAENAEGAAERAGVAVVPAEVVAAWEVEAAELAEGTAEGEAVNAEASGEGVFADADAASADSDADEDEGASGASLEAALLGGSSARYTALGNLMYDPQPGDLVFFDWNNDGSADHVGLVYELLDVDGNVVAEAVAPESEAVSSAGGEGSEDAPNSAAGAATAGVAGDSAAEGVGAAAVAPSSASAAKLKTIEGNVSDGSTDAVCYREYDLTDSSILGYAALPENPELQVATLSLEHATAATSSIKSNAPTTVDFASTKDFIDLNLYDYSKSINKSWNNDKRYPGFQWNGGAYMYSSTFNRHVVDYIDFGNSNITDIGYGGSGTTVANGKSKNAVDVARNGGAINELDISSYGVTNRPVGMSTGEDVLSRTLIDGYPALSDGTSLAYLFTNDGNAVKKQNTESIDGLFQKDETTGAYFYNSRLNHAQYSNNEFTLYDQIITPNFIVYPFGNFLPFNTITDSSKATQVGSIDGKSGSTVSDYIESLQNDMSGSLEDSPTKTQLTAMLEKYQKSINGAGINSSKQAIADYFTAGGGNGDKPSSDTSPITDALLAKMYNIDWDEETNFFFGMDMTMNFMQPKDGLTGNDGQQPMEFYFTGDDDVWVYIDGVLFLDLSGIHRHVGGKIDFVEGKVHYYALDTENGGDVSKWYQSYTFAELLTAAGKSTDVLDSESGTFKDYTTHQFKFYYMERGSGSSVCRMNFNFPLLEKNSISVSKEVENKTPGALGNPDYKFQVLKADKNGVKTSELFVDDKSEYEIYDADGDKVGTAKADANGVFSLKAGQTAKFSNIPENAGKYYVRELFDAATLEQYGNVTVSGESTTTSDGLTVGTDKFTGVDSPVKDMSDGSTAFRFLNSIDATKELASLSITKKLEEYPQAREAKQFDIEVKLDDKLLPEGTEYTVKVGAGEWDETREVLVEKPGVVTLGPGETATIGGILAGTRFSVQEVAESAEGYAVTYKVDGQDPASGSATGSLSAATKVNVLVTNKEKGASVVIPGTKSVAASDESKHEFSFALYGAKRVSDQGAFSVDASDGASPLQSAKVDPGEDGSSFSFTVDYALVDLSSLPASFYYCIAEKPSEDALLNSTAYVVEVTVSAESQAAITRAWVGTLDDSTLSGLKQCFDSGAGDSASTPFSADFTNILIGSLELSKKIVGTESDRSFEFEVSLNPSGSGLEVLPDSYRATLYSPDDDAGRSVEVELSERDDGKFVLILKSEDDENGKPIALKHGERIVINGIPYGTQWTVAETDSEGFIVSTDVVCPTVPSEELSGEAGASGLVSSADPSANDGGSASSADSDASSDASSAAVSGSIVMGTTQVNFTNTQMYELPETGGLGAAVCVFAGLALVGAALFGMRRIRHRGEAV